jgi:hypothetical protein
MSLVVFALLGPGHWVIVLVVAPSSLAGGVPAGVRPSVRAFA